jgi:hypothetical protein
MMRTKRSIFVFAVFFSGQLYSQPPGIIESPEPVPSIDNAPDLRSADRIPDDAQIMYSPGNAPHFINLRAYTTNAMAALRHEMKMVDIESDALGISRDEFEALAQLLDAYRSKENADWVSHLALVCAPYLRGEETTPEYARSALAQLDDSDGRKALLAEEVMTDVVAAFGQDLAANLFLRIEEYGKSVRYTKIDLLKFVDETEGLEADSYLASECAAL